MTISKFLAFNLELKMNIAASLIVHFEDMEN